MKTNHYDYIIKEIPIFAGLSPREWQYLKRTIRFEEFRKGQVIYKEGQPPTSFYCIIRGRVVVSALDHAGKSGILEYLHRGQYFGIISVLTGEPHSVTAKALNDCLLLEISKDDFDALLRKAPQLAIDLSTTLSRRLKRKDIHPKTIFESTIIAVLSSYPQAGKTVYASNLAFSLAQQSHKKTIILDICPQDKRHRMPRFLKIGSQYRVCSLSSRGPGPDRLKSCILKDKFGIDIIYFTYAEIDGFWPRTVVDVLSLLVNDYHFIILDLPSRKEKRVLRILNQADIIHILTSPKPAHLKSTRGLIKKLEEDFGFPSSKIKVVANVAGGAQTPTDQMQAILQHDIFANLPRIEARVSARLVVEKPDAEYSKVIRRIARQEGDCLVGLALGVGVAYGFCHIGVLRVIEEEHIPIDVVSGSSIGAFIASLWAIGKSSAEILAIVKEFREPKYLLNLLDFTFPLLGFIKGNKIYNVFKQYIGDKTFYDVKIPLKIIASDVKRKQPIVFDKGPIIDAIMASCSMPGVFAPFARKGEMLFDGGVISPLPTEPLFEMGVKKIIAVNLTPDRDDIMHTYERAKQGFSDGVEKIKKKEWFNLKDYVRKKLNVNILDFIFSSFEIMQSEVALKEAQLADVVLHPDTSGLHWMELHRAEEFAKRGEEEARRHLDKMKKLIDE
ncbi:MAG: cyclic nucleotide-binding domain-containing protein [Candidatus Omnitrophica bacterium]|nr:cyclic nucleotide-binding domain-containing protein [Candidatus Omnitrophota bacterium]